ncbi:hypothetical protein D9M72_548440 [compost metagenome]
MAGRGGDDDGVIWRVFLPAVVAIADFACHLLVGQPLQPVAGLPTQRLDDLDGVDRPDQSGQHSRLVTRAGADLQHGIARLCHQQVSHQAHDVGLRDGLAVADGQRAVVIGVRLLRIGDEFVPRHLAHHRHHAPVQRVPAAGCAGSGRDGGNLLHHVGALGCACVLGAGAAPWQRHGQGGSEQEEGG